MKEKSIKGRAFLIKDSDGKYIDNVDTDMIFHNSHLHITEINEMGKHAFGNLKGYKNFPQKAKKGDIVFIGGNFGSGSSRQQAVDCFTALGVKAIIAKSFGSIYKRNAINSGMPIFSCPNMDNINLENMSEINFDFQSGEVKDSKGKTIGKTEPMNKVQMDIFEAGGIFNYAKKLT